MKFLKTFAGAVVLAASTSAFAEQTLQEVLDSITVGGNSSINTATDAVAADQYWQNGGSGGSVATFIIELTSGAPNQSFGIYDKADSSNQITIFNGADTNSDQRTIQFLADGTVRVVDLNALVVIDSGNIGNRDFGFFLSTAGQTFYSDESLNSNGEDRFVAFEGQGDNIQIPGYSPGVWAANEFILGWEDGSDFDYQDMVVMVESISPVAEPGSLALLGLGLAGLGMARRKQK